MYMTICSRQVFYFVNAFVCICKYWFLNIWGILLFCDFNVMYNIVKEIRVEETKRKQKMKMTQKQMKRKKQQCETSPVSEKWQESDDNIDNVKSAKESEKDKMLNGIQSQEQQQNYRFLKSKWGILYSFWKVNDKDFFVDMSVWYKKFSKI